MVFPDEVITQKQALHIRHRWINYLGDNSGFHLNQDLLQGVETFFSGHENMKGFRLQVTKTNTAQEKYGQAGERWARQNMIFIGCVHVLAGNNTQVLFSDLCQVLTEMAVCYECG